MPRKIAKILIILIGKILILKVIKLLAILLIISLDTKKRINDIIKLNKVRNSNSVINKVLICFSLIPKFFKIAIFF